MKNAIQGNTNKQERIYNKLINVTMDNKNLNNLKDI